MAVLFSGLNSRQRAGVSLAVSGIISLVVGVVIGFTVETPRIVNIALDILASLFPLLGLVVNFPSDTNPK